MSEVTLTDETIDRIAERVVEMQRGESTGPELIDATECARRLGVSRDYLYAHANELGAVRLGAGPKARLRFDPEQVVAALAPRPFPEPGPAQTPPRRRPQRHPDVELLPIGKP